MGSDQANKSWDIIHSLNSSEVFATQCKLLWLDWGWHLAKVMEYSSPDAFCHIIRSYHDTKKT